MGEPGIKGFQVSGVSLNLLIYQHVNDSSYQNSKLFPDISRDLGVSLVLWALLVQKGDQENQ